jgi:hypothetical protein
MDMSRLIWLQIIGDVYTNIGSGWIITLFADLPRDSLGAVTLIFRIFCVILSLFTVKFIRTEESKYV